MVSARVLTPGHAACGHAGGIALQAVDRLCRARSSAEREGCTWAMRRATCRRSTKRLRWKFRSVIAAMPDHLSLSVRAARALHGSRQQGGCPPACTGSLRTGSTPTDRGARRARGAGGLGFGLDERGAPLWRAASARCARTLRFGARSRGMRGRARRRRTRRKTAPTREEKKGSEMNSSVTRADVPQGVGGHGGAGCDGRGRVLSRRMAGRGGSRRRLVRAQRRRIASANGCSSKCGLVRHHAGAASCSRCAAATCIRTRKGTICGSRSTAWRRSPTPTSA